jgi:hypothetical protein
VKTKTAVFFVLLVTGAAVQAGPRVNVVVNPGRGCAPAPICRPVVYRTYPTFWGTPATAFYSWGPSVVVASNGSGFSTVSPLMNYTGQTSTPVYKVPPPVLPAQPVVTYPSSPFRWRN